MPDVVDQMTASELKARLDEGRPFAVLDVREPDERDYASIPLPGEVADLHVPLGELTHRFEEVRSAAEGQTLVVYCHHGQRSMVAATWLLRRGLLDIRNLEGGIDAWSTRVDPKVRRY